jgi:hypothetical protein
MSHFGVVMRERGQLALAFGFAAHVVENRTRLHLALFDHPNGCIRPNSC